MNLRDFLNLFTASALLGGLAFWPAACASRSVRSSVSDNYHLDSLGEPGLVSAQGEREKPEAGSDRSAGDSASAVVHRNDRRKHTERRVPPRPVLRALATSQARRCRVDVSLFHRLIARESSWNPRAISSSGARGLTQLLPRYHSHPLLNIDDPQTNLSIGCAYLRRLIDLRRGNVRLALLDYNAGQNRTITTSATLAYATEILGGMNQ